MTYQIFTRLGLFTGAVLYTSHMSVWADPGDASDSTERITRRCKNISNITGIRFNQKGFVAQLDYNIAMKRGFYFAYRMPDWTSEFVKHTSDILSENKQETNKKGIYRSRDHRVWHATADNTPDIDCNPAANTSLDKMANRPKKHPKIKDDITCHKRN